MENYINAVRTFGANQFTSGVAKQETQYDLWTVLNTIINVALGIIGFVAVVMIIVDGFQYSTSAGDASKVTKAKNTIMYGIIGLVIAILAAAIVNFVLANVFGIK